MYPEIEYFKRFAKCYLMWSHSNMDRIVSDIIKKDVKTEAMRKQKIIMTKLPQYKAEPFDFDFERDVKFGIKILKDLGNLS